MTAAELISKRADAGKENMGLTSWKGGKVRKRDVTIAKNYLSEKELKSLNRIVTMYLDYAEDQAERQRPMYMKDWVDKLNAFLQSSVRSKSSSTFLIVLDLSICLIAMLSINNGSNYFGIFLDVFL